MEEKISDQFNEVDEAFPKSLFGGLAQAQLESSPNQRRCQFCSQAWHPLSKCLKYIYIMLRKPDRKSQELGLKLLLDYHGYLI